jgi:hypothetical protein
MNFRDRIIRFERVPAGQLRPNPKNWRTHPAQQRDAMRAVLEEIGYAGTICGQLTYLCFSAGTGRPAGRAIRLPNG